MTIRDFTPKNELERAYIQARFCDALHSWRKGTTDLNAKKMGIASAKYLAMMRKQLLRGEENEAVVTLDSIWSYKGLLANSEKLSVIRIICSIVSEIDADEIQQISFKNARPRLVEVAVALSTDLEDDKVAQVEALTLLKKETSTDLFAAKIEKDDIASLENLLDETKRMYGNSTRTTQNTEFNQEQAEQRRKRINAVLKTAATISNDVNVYLLLTDFAYYLLDKNLLLEVEILCPSIRAFAQLLYTQKRKVVYDAWTDFYVARIWNLRNTTSLSLLESITKVLSQSVVERQIFEKQYRRWEDKLSSDLQIKDERPTAEDIKTKSYDELVIELTLARSLNILTDRLLGKEFHDEARAFSKLAIFGKICAKACDQRDVEDLAAIAAAGLSSKDYKNTRTYLLEMQSTLNFTDNHSRWIERLRVFSQLLVDLFSKLETPGALLTFREFSTINYMHILSNKLLNAAQLKSLTEQIIELLGTRLDESISEETLKVLWRETDALTVEKVFSTYIEPLAVLTEMKLNPEMANDCYLDFCETLRQQRLESNYLVDFLSKIIDSRSKRNLPTSSSEFEETSVLSIAMLALTAQAQALEHNYKESFSICEKILEISKSILPKVEAINVQLIRHLFRAETALLIIDKRAPKVCAFETAESMADLISCLLSNGTFKNNQIGQWVTNFMAQLSQGKLELPKSLCRLIDQFGPEIMVDNLDYLERSFSPQIVLDVIDQLVLTKLESGIKANTNTLLLLLEHKSKTLRKSCKPSEELLIQIVEMQKAIVISAREANEVPAIFDKSTDARYKARFLETFSKDGFFKIQMSYVDTVLQKPTAGKRELAKAHEFVSKLVEESAEFLDTYKVISLTHVVDRFLAERETFQAISLFLSLMLKSKNIEFSNSMLSTFDNVLSACLDLKEFAKAQLILAQSSLVARTDFEPPDPKQFVERAANRMLNLWRNEDTVESKHVVDSKLSNLSSGLDVLNLKHEELKNFHDFIRAELSDDTTKS